MQVQISPAAAAFVQANGGELWIWAARPRMCCAGTPAWMHAAVTRPDGRSVFTAVEVVPAAAARIQIHFRPPGGLSPDILEIGMHGRRDPKVQAYWDGCLMAMT